MNSIPVDPAAIAETYIFRHGETDWNAQGRFQGRMDTPLNEKGREQARVIGAALRDEFASTGRKPSDFRFIASPLARAKETMTIVAGYLGDPEWRDEEALLEVSYGRWEGLTSAEVKQRFGEERRGRRTNAWMFAPQGGESFQEMSARVLPWRIGLGVPAVIGAHAGTIRVFAAACGLMSPDESVRTPVPQGALFHIADGKLRMVNGDWP